MSEEPRHTAIVTRAAAAGTLGALLLVGSDFAASWQWLERTSDRIGLALHLAGLLLPVGALLACTAVWIDRRCRPLWIRRVPRLAIPALAPLPLCLALSPAAFLLGWSTLQGARASRLPLVPLWIAVLSIATLLAIYVGARALRAMRSSRPAARWTAALLLACAAFGAAKLDQLAYPRQYAGLHGALTAAAWVFGASASWLALPPIRVAIPPTRVVAGLVALAGLHLATLPHDHDGRAALLSPRASSARSVMLAIAPALFALPRTTASADAVARADRAARRRQRSLATGRLPEWPDAHVVLITIDALRADHLGLYGHRRPISPNLDAFAAESVVFERAWTTTPRSSWSLCSLMTGHALHARDVRGEPLVRPTIAERMAAHGYYTAGFYPDGIFVHDGAPLAHYRRRELGFERHDAENHDAQSLTDAVIEELRDLRTRGEPKALLWIHYFDVHEPYEETSLGTRPVDRYDGEIRNVDRAFARLRAALDDELARDAIVIVSADHGEEHGDHGGAYHGDSLYEEQLHVPLIVHAPGLAPRRVRSPVSLLDVAPTIDGMLGRPHVASDGFDLRALLVGRAVDRGPVCATEDGLRATLRWPFKRIDGLGTVELFDLENDRGERRSLADTRSDVLETLAADRCAWMP